MAWWVIDPERFFESSPGSPESSLESRPALLPSSQAAVVRIRVSWIGDLKPHHQIDAPRRRPAMPLEAHKAMTQATTAPAATAQRANSRQRNELRGRAAALLTNFLRRHRQRGVFVGIAVHPASTELDQSFNQSRASARSSSWFALHASLARGSLEELLLDRFSDLFQTGLRTLNVDAANIDTALGPSPSLRRG